MSTGDLSWSNLTPQVNIHLKERDGGDPVVLVTEEGEEEDSDE